MDEQEKQEGFDAIAAQLERLYPGQEGVYYGTIIPAFLGGGDPLDGVEIYQSQEERPHWHYITYGFSELYEKESENAEVSGFGFELTFRLLRGEEAEPPVWPVNLLQNLARYVFEYGNPFGSGHHMNCNGPVCLDSDTELTALGFITDPQLGSMDTPNGRVEFLQAVALTHDEMNAQMCWKGESFLRLLETRQPLWITDLDRKSLMQQPDIRASWQQGVQQDGTSTSALYMDEMAAQLENGHVTLQLGAGHTETISIMLQARVGKNRPLILQGREQVFFLNPGEHCSAQMDGEYIALTLTPEAVQEICQALQPHAGSYTMQQAPLTVVLVPTTIRDRHGNITEVIE